MVKPSDASSITWIPSPNYGNLAAVSASPQGNGTRVRARVLESELKVTHEDMPIMAHRAAKLYLDGKDQVRWGSVSHSSNRFGVRAYANCLRTTDVVGEGDFPSPPVIHDSPHANCTCGIYAHPIGVISEFSSSDKVDLLVQLGGKVLVGDTGYRAGFQQVLECVLPNCGACNSDQPVEVQFLYPSNLSGGRVLNRTMCVRCAPHNPPGHSACGVRTLAARCPVPLKRSNGETIAPG